MAVWWFIVSSDVLVATNLRIIPEVQQRPVPQARVEGQRERNTRHGRRRARHRVRAHAAIARAAGGC